jgi:hypothetical protein
MKQQIHFLKLSKRFPLTQASKRDQALKRMYEYEVYDTLNYITQTFIGDCPLSKAYANIPSGI